ncbi:MULTISPECIES: SHOCT domain-containing protein [Streptomyces]|uniref:SHOCT domain-containing protein n=1 Tax=Streptomyces TaxID=1883 RepID=UPI000F6B3953|nr:SHOCT domain-containing protein [Streptomyces sp. W1SF4]AZM87917.1 SHOCT domain-containing protein [Streptomyces sp. W1SF4]
MYWNDHMGAWDWFAMSFTTLIVWGLIAAVAVLVVRTLKRDGAAGRAAPRPAAGTASTRAEPLLAERYARGEIDDEEYKRRLAVLRSHAAGPTPR